MCRLGFGVRIICAFLIGLCSLTAESLELYWYLGNSLSAMSFTHVFSPVSGLSSYSLDSAFTEQEVLILTKSSLPVIFDRSCGGCCICRWSHTRGVVVSSWKPHPPSLRGAPPFPGNCLLWSLFESENCSSLSVTVSLVCVLCPLPFHLCVSAKWVSYILHFNPVYFQLHWIFFS